MLSISGYKVTQDLFKDSRHNIVRAIRLKDNARVVLKVSSNQQQSTASPGKELKHEYSILARLLGVKGVIKAHAFIKKKELTYLELEDNGLQPLSKYLERGSLSLAEFLVFAIELVKVIKKIHEKEVIHKDINPSNILWDAVTKELIILDFEIASTNKNDYVDLKNVLCGSLYYISPEQTGRTNSHIDYRTDLYSMGVVFYQIITGKLPFQSDDMLELVYNHIAKIAVPPHQLNPEIPLVISRIIMKLLAKQPEERYQDEECIIEDLSYCLENLQQKKEISNFQIAQYDVIKSFTTSNKLYGRENEERVLKETLDRVANGQSAVTQVYGSSGVGKTVLIHHMYELILPKKGYFIEGKFEQFNAQMPHLALTQCISDFAKQLASASQTEIEQWREKILEAVGENGQILIDIAPELEWIIGPQNPLLSLSGVALENRFLFVIEQFFKVLGSKDHPLVLFWDDMQWIDAVSLNVIERLLSSTNLGYIYIILSYRDEQQSIVDSMENLFDHISLSTEHSTLCLQPLTLDDTIAMLADSIAMPSDQLITIAKICHEKTCGNPLYINEFLRDLSEEKLICFDKKSRAWKIDINQIASKSITFNAVEIVLQRMKKMPNEVINLLGSAACIGNKFELSVLSKLLDLNEEVTAKIISQALKENYLVPLSEKCIYAEETDQSGAVYGFSHDKIYEASYSLLSNVKKEALNYKIAIIINNIRGKSKSSNYSISDIARYFDEGLAHIKEQERLMVIKINLESSKQADLALAHKQALYFLGKAISLVREPDWTSDYELILELYTQAIRIQALCGNVKELDALSAIVLQHSRQFTDEIAIYRVKILYYTANRLPENAVELGLWLLKKLNFPLPLHPKKLHLIKSAVASRFKSLRIPAEQIPNLPQMTNSHYLIIMQIFSDILLSAAQTNQKLFGLICSKIYYLTLRYGLSDITPMGCIGYGVIQAGIFKNYEVAYRYGKIGFQLAETYNCKKILPHAMIIFGGFINHTKNHYKSNLQLLEKGSNVALEVGNIELLAMSSFLAAIQSFHMGKKLSSVQRKIDNALKLSRFLTQVYQVRYVYLHQAIIANLTEENDDSATILVNAKNNLAKERKAFDESQDQIGIHFLYCLKVILCILFHDNQAALFYSEKIRKSMKNMLSHVLVPIYLFYDGYALSCGYHATSGLTRIKARTIIKHHLKELQRFSKSCPSNYAAKYHLLLAKWHEANGRYKLAASNFQAAIDFAGDNKLLSDQALAYESASDFYFQSNQRKIAAMYMRDAYDCYRDWGASAKVKALEHKHVWLVQSEQPPNLQIHSATMTSINVDSRSLDSISALKASIAVANEIKLPELIKQLLAVITENIAAQRSLLLLQRDNKLYIEGEYDAQAGLIQLLPMIDMRDRAKDIPISILQYVATSQETVLLEDAYEDKQFARDSYIAKSKVKSLLVLPLIYQHRLVGILYFEHRLIAGVFTKERLNFLRMMTPQVVISLQNAELYASFERFVPQKFLQLLGKENPSAIKLGDSVQKFITILFADLRGFTTLTEEMDVANLFTLLNKFLGEMEPIIASHGGFIDKYIGDAIMALFPRSALDALQTAIHMCFMLAKFNEQSSRTLNLGIGISSGIGMLGTVGSSQRMDGSIISDAVNSASRIEHLNKRYGTRILISEETRLQLPPDHTLNLRLVDKVILRGRTKKSILWEVLDCLPEELLRIRLLNIPIFNQALKDYLQGNFNVAKDGFLTCLNSDPSDKVAKYHYTNCLKNLKK